MQLGTTLSAPLGLANGSEGRGAGAEREILKTMKGHMYVEK